MASRLVTATRRSAALPELVRQLDAAGVSAEDVGLRRPTLDEVFLDRTGRNGRTGRDEEVAA